jgi:hypothetical protein
VDGLRWQERRREQFLWRRILGRRRKLGRRVVGELVEAQEKSRKRTDT